MSEVNTYKQSLLKKYMNGSITDAERHELEKLALDDVFLFEAMEGFHIAGIPVRKFELKAENETAEAKIVPFKRFISIAASFLLIAAAIYLIKPMLGVQDSMLQEESTEYAAVIEAKDDQNSVLPPVENTEQSVAETTASNIPRVKKEKTVIEKDVAELEPRVAKRAVPTPSKTEVSDEMEDMENMDVADEAVGSGFSSEEETVEVAGSRAAGSSVVTIDGIAVKKSPAMEVDMDHATSPTSNSAKIGAQKMSKKATTVQPEMGEPAFQEYLDKATADNTICAGRVTVRFSFTPTGNPVDFTVIDAQSEICNQEVIRIIEEAGKWIITPTAEAVHKEISLNFNR